MIIHMNKMRFARLHKKWHEFEHGIRILFQSLNKNQKNLIIAMVTVCVFSAIFIIARTRSNVFMVLPIPGGTWTEGLIGTARFINPVLAVSNIDKDITSIVFSGLVKKQPDGTYSGDIAESYTIDDSGLVYSFTIRDDAKFHDGKKITSEDIAYTIERIKDPLEKSPRNVEWQGITVKVIDEKNITLSLKQPFNDFLDIATVGILPKHIYGKYSANEFAQAKENLEAVGSGPYKISSVSKTKNMPKSIKLTKAYRGEENGYIKKIIFNFYDKEESAISALKSGKIDHFGGVTAKDAKELENKGYTITLSSLPRIYGMFFNTKKTSILIQPHVTEVIASSINKKQIIDSVLDGFGGVIDAPIPSDLYKKINYKYETVDVEKTLKGAGWEKGNDGYWEKTISTIKPGSKKAQKSTEKLSFTITTSDTPELRKGAEEIAAELAKNGIIATVASYDATTLEEKIRTRDYEALYYGIQMSRESQVYAFWHSSQREHPGLNIAGYTNAKADLALEALQKETDPEERISLWKKFAAAFYTDIPAVFIYSPSYIYVHNQKPLFMVPEAITSSNDRFNNIKSWYLETEKVLPFIYKLKNN